MEKISKFHQIYCIPDTVLDLRGQSLLLSRSLYLLPHHLHSHLGQALGRQEGIDVEDL